MQFLPFGDPGALALYAAFGSGTNKAVVLEINRHIKTDI
jgi:hypothetical protein